MKILWFPRLQPDAGKLHLTTWREMCNELESSGCTVKIAITGKDPGNTLNRECIEIFLIKRKLLRLPCFWADGFIKFIYNFFVFKPDAVILDTFSVWFSIPFIFNWKRKTVFIVDNRTPHHNLIPGSTTFRDRIIKINTKLCYLYSKYLLDGMTVINDFYKEQIHRDNKYPADSIAVWSSGVDIKKIFPLECRNKDRPDFLKSKFVLMQHGEFSYNRGILETINAINLLEKKDICLVLLGEGNLKHKIIREIETLGLAGMVYVLPPVPHSEVQTYISYCDCSIMAYPDIEYWNNNNPLKFLEYLAMGKVVICPNMTTFNSIAGNRKCTHYIGDNNPETIAKAINYCYRNREKLNEWGREGIDIVKNKYTWQIQAGILREFIELLQERKRM